MDPVKEKANYSRVCQLLVNKGSIALRNALHSKHPPSTLASVLNTNKPVLTKLRYRVIKDPQWDLLFPTSGAPDSTNFDITLLTILLRNVCRLSSPTAGWDVFPVGSDVSVSADIVRMKMLRNDIYGHIATAQFDDTRFHALWQDISKPLTRLGISQNDIDELKDCPLSPEEEIYIEELKKWKELDEDILLKMRDLEGKMDTLKEKLEVKVECVEEKVDNVEEKVGNVEDKVDNVDHKVVALRTALENATPSQVDKLAKFDFTGKIASLCKKFQDGTRQWLFDKISHGLLNDRKKVIILTASPGFGKSVLLAKICEMYKQSGQLAASHFCDFRSSDYSNPHKIIQSLASQICENVVGFRDKLTEVLRREHSRESLSDAFRVLLNDPLHALPTKQKMTIVVDALDESESNPRSEFLELLLEKFLELPEWIGILISSRPEQLVRRNIAKHYLLEINPDDHQHRLDLEHFMQHNFLKLKPGTVKSLVDYCQGSFLYAYFLVSENVGTGIDPSPSKGISGFYDKQFKRLKTGLKRCVKDACSSVLKSFINVVAAAREPLPVKILLSCMGLSDEDYETREIIFDVMSEILPVYDGCLTVYHKSLWDWLTADGYEEHAFVADVADGKERLWRACEREYSEIESLKSVSDFQITPAVMYALEHGANYLLIHHAKDFRWLLNVRINYLKLKYFRSDLISKLNFSRILEVYKSIGPNFTNPLHRRIVQLNSFSQRIKDLQLKSLLLENVDVSYIDVYLQFVANEYHSFQHTYDPATRCDTEDILKNATEIWVQEMEMESKNDSKWKIISHGISRNHQLLYIASRAMEVSPNNDLLAFLGNDRVEVFKLPSLEIIFEVKIEPLGSFLRFVKFSPDTSYFLCNSIRFCVSIREQEKVPFIPQGPEECLCCSSSACGKKLVTSEPNCIKTWDVEKKIMLAEVSTEVDVEYCFFSNSGSFILARPWDDELNFEAIVNFHDFVVLGSSTLKRLNADIGKICVDRCLRQGSCYQLFSPAPCGPSLLNRTVRICHFHLPTDEIVLIANKHCTKPFVWKERNCVAFSNSIAGSSELQVYDYINQEIIDFFYVNILPGDTFISYITKMEGENFLVCTNSTELFIVSFETTTHSFPITLVKLAGELKCCSMSPRGTHLACCYENCVVTIEGIDCRKILQSFVLKQQPEACWWSQSYLWIVCKGVVVKCDCLSTENKVLGNEKEECVIEYDKVFKFDQGVLVIRLPENGNIFILKLVNENLCRQEIPDSHFDASSVAISSDGCAILLYQKSGSKYQMWEKAHNNRWELLADGNLNYAVNWFCLTGREGSRSSLWLMFISSSNFEDNLNEPVFLSSIDFPSKKMVLSQDILLSIFFNDKNIVYVDSHLLVVNQGAWLYYIDISQGEVIAKLHLDFRTRGKKLSYFYIFSEDLLLIANYEGVKYFKIHNVRNLLKDK